MLREEGPALSNISIEPSNYFLFSYGLSISIIIYRIYNIYLSDFIKTWALGFCLQSGVQKIRGCPNCGWVDQARGSKLVGQEGAVLTQPLQQCSVEVLTDNYLFLICPAESGLC